MQSEERQRETGADLSIQGHVNSRGEKVARNSVTGTALNNLNLSKLQAAMGCG